LPPAGFVAVNAPVFPFSPAAWLVVVNFHSPVAGGLNRTLKVLRPSQKPATVMLGLACLNVAENFTSMGEPAGG
jgi:hypothetical protein